MNKRIVDLIAATVFVAASVACIAFYFVTKEFIFIPVGVLFGLVSGLVYYVTLRKA